VRFEKKKKKVIFKNAVKRLAKSQLAFKIMRFQKITILPTI